jgi:ATP-dependent DNA helicase RecG
MTSQDKFIALTRKGEDTRIEYKTCTEEISESLYESVCSLLNHSGGHILVGVQNDGTIVGVNPEKVETSIGKNEVTVEESGTNDPAADFVRKTLEGLS